MVSETDGVVSIYKVNSGPQLPHASSFIKPNKTMDLQTKRKMTRYLTVYTKEMGNLVPED